MMEEIVLNDYYASLVISAEREGNDPTFTPYRRRRIIKMDEFNQRFGEATNQAGMILPQNTRYVERVGRQGLLLVIEESPRVRTVNVEMDMVGTIEKLKITGHLKEYGYENWLEENKKIPYKFRLAFPYIVYVMFMDGGSLVSAHPYYRLHPLTSLEDYLLKPNLPNIGSGGALCLGSNPQDGHTKNPFEAANVALEKFWVNAFNTDYASRYTSYDKIPFVSDWLTWQYHTIQDPMFIYSVPWIKEPKILIDAIKDVIERDRRYGTGVALSFDSLRSIFTKRVPSKDDPMFYHNVTESVIVGSATLAIGDEVEYQKKPYYVHSFSGKRLCRPVSVNLEDDEGNIKEVNLTASTEKQFEKQLLGEKRLKYVTVQDQEVSVGDILVLSYPENAYRKVSKIRQGRDGKIEVQCNQTDYYLLENLKFSRFTDNLINIDGVEVGKDEEVYLLDIHNSSSNPLCVGSKVVFCGFSDTRDGVLIGEFKDVDTDQPEIHSVRLQNSSKRLVKMEDMYIPPVYRIFCNLHTNTPRDTPQYPLMRKYGSLTPRRGIEGNRYHQAYATKKILSEDKSELHIPGFDIDINFKVGDSVVISDWEHPLEMLKVRTIQSFTIEGSALFVNTITAKGVERKDLYINLITGCIWTGTIRHIMPEFGGIKAGDKIRANTPGITMFPKKDTNTVIGFLSDCGEDHYPLMLCSNCCTQWASPAGLSRFDVIRRGTPQWMKAKNAPIQISKIKYQCGDMVCSLNDSPQFYVGVYHKYGGEVRMTDLRQWGTGYYNDITEYTRERWRRVGFISPRYQQRVLGELRRRQKAGFSNLHNGFTPYPTTENRYREDWDYVQCLD